MCENGHNICGSCRESLSNCPTCRGTFINARNITVENLAATAVYPCKNREAGCEETFTADDRNEHLFVCLYESRKCPIRVISNVDCSWSGKVLDISAHIRSVHSPDTVEMTGHFKVNLLDFVRGRFYLRHVLILGELFFILGGSESEDFECTVLHIGPRKETEAFKYGIKIGNSAEYVAVTRKCHGYLDLVSKLSPRRKYVASYDTVLDFVSENGCLSCEIEIGREKLDGFVLEELQEFLPVVSAVSIDMD